MSYGIAVNGVWVQLTCSADYQGKELTPCILRFSRVPCIGEHINLLEVPGSAKPGWYGTFKVTAVFHFQGPDDAHSVAAEIELEDVT